VTIWAECDRCGGKEFDMLYGGIFRCSKCNKINELLNKVFQGKITYFPANRSIIEAMKRFIEKPDEEEL